MQTVEDVEFSKKTAPSVRSSNSIVKKSEHVKLDIKTWIRIALVNKEYFYNPFTNWQSYLYIYKDRPKCVEFYDLQRLDWNGEVTPKSYGFWKHLWKNEEFKPWMEKRAKAWQVELNEANWNQDLHPLLESLPGDVRRARLLKLPAGHSMPLHKDETSKKDIRVICPIITSPKITNTFDVDGEVHEFFLPADGSFYCFDERIPHGVINDSTRDRYALVFTVLDTTFEEWDAKGKQG